ncbi:TlpA family protein disulfide reductase [Zhouia spongiae]|uniref:TlpA family protein disulfide reductase n=1 Tax=Zhouia spongiae TaxID=2202721 RepID=A0ABY3YL61_9FLAO|nr:TlpA disulfide reductase family protein [Zhouia spongiae]UNY98557.1 TlpA family protein disulfide reductase [Zhouia spongiae]
MKIYLYTCALVFILASCVKEQRNDFIILQGKVLNKKSNTLRLSSLCYSYSHDIPLNEDGTFVDTIRTKADNLMLYYGGHLTYMYLESGDDIHLTFDVKDYNNTVTFTGAGAAYNNYLLQKRKRVSEVLSDVKNIYLLNEVDFKETQKKLESELLKLLKNTKYFPATYIEKEKRNIKYYTLNNLNKYQVNHIYQTKNNDFRVSDAFLKELEEIAYNNGEDYIFSYDYSSLVDSYCQQQAREISASLNIDEDVAYLKAVNMLSNQKIKNIICYKKAKNGITYTADVENYYAEYIKGSTNEVNNKEITKNYNALKIVAKGKPSPEFTDYENFDNSTTSLSDLKGKYLYIDVWATWCGPCKREIPFLKKIESRYHDKNIEFVSISIDNPEDRNKWRQMVEKENLGGVQLLADNAFNSKFVQDYLIKGIPRFILLDPQGNIVMANAPRPSDDKLIALLATLSL